MLPQLVGGYEPETANTVIENGVRKHERPRSRATSRTLKGIRRRGVPKHQRRYNEASSGAFKVDAAKYENWEATWSAQPWFGSKTVAGGKQAEKERSPKQSGPRRKPTSARARRQGHRAPGHHASQGKGIAGRLPRFCAVSDKPEEETETCAKPRPSAQRVFENSACTYHPSGFCGASDIARKTERFPARGPGAEQETK